MKKTGDFTHAMYDDISETVFLYFEEITVLNLSTGSEHQLKECCLYLKPEEYVIMREYFLNHNTVEELI